MLTSTIKNCIEGMANANSIAARIGVQASELKDLKDDAEAWEIESHYLAHLCTTVTLVASPEVIVLGGGVFRRKCLVPLIHRKTLALLNSYLKIDKILNHIDRYITLSVYGDDSGIMGALALAKASLK